MNFMFIIQFRIYTSKYPKSMAAQIHTWVSLPPILDTKGFQTKSCAITQCIDPGLARILVAWTTHAVAQHKCRAVSQNVAQSVRPRFHLLHRLKALPCLCVRMCVRVRVCVCVCLLACVCMFMWKREREGVMCLHVWAFAEILYLVYSFIQPISTRLSNVTWTEIIPKRRARELAGRLPFWGNESYVRVNWNLVHLLSHDYLCEPINQLAWFRAKLYPNKYSDLRNPRTYAPLFHPPRPFECVPTAVQHTTTHSWSAAVDHTWETCVLREIGKWKADSVRSCKNRSREREREKG